jgi:anti-anti-sigma factor
MIAHESYDALQWVRDDSRAGATEVRVVGCADISSAASLAALEEHLRDDSEVVLNVAEMVFADTTFLRFLVRLRPFPYSKDRRSITLIGVSRQLKRVLEITGLGRFFSYARQRCL